MRIGELVRGKPLPLGESMDESPFRDDRTALRSIIEELQRENQSLAAQVRTLQAEIEQLREATPENQQAFVRRLQEDNEELRARVAELEPLRERVRTYEHRLRRESNPFGPFEPLIRRIFGDSSDE
jgi:predicted RNase H-like nuclease (RuvC/YqgF family)